MALTRKLKEEEDPLWAVSSCQVSKMTVASCSPSNILAPSLTFLEHLRSGWDPAAAQTCFPLWQGFVPSPEQVTSLQKQTHPPACSWPGRPWPQRDTSLCDKQGTWKIRLRRNWKLQVLTTNRDRMAAALSFMQEVCLGTFGAVPGHKPLEISLAELTAVFMEALACLFPAGAHGQSLWRHPQAPTRFHERSSFAAGDWWKSPVLCTSWQMEQFPGNWKQLV